MHGSGRGKDNKIQQRAVGLCRTASMDIHGSVHDGCLKFWHYFFQVERCGDIVTLDTAGSAVRSGQGCVCALCRCGMVLEAQLLIPVQGESEWGHCTPQAVSWAGCLCLFWM